MAQKTFNTRIQHKHDVEANWNLATNFIPLAGELIVYDTDATYDYIRFKVGDGSTKLSELPFVVISWNDLADKPFGEESINITWDGNTEGRESFDAMPEMPGYYLCYKVSDIILSPEDVAGSTIETTMFTGDVTSTNSDFIDDKPDKGLFSINMVSVFCVYNETNVAGVTPGVYFMSVPGEGYTSALICQGAVKTLDDKYISSNIARTSDIPSVDDYATTEYVDSKIVQPDWDQTDDTAVDFIKNKPIEATDEDFLIWLNEEDIVEPMTSASGEIYTAQNNEIYIL